nr:integrase, catalytic region, zinc finger, CCHC-type, peptidase aspartic, catalytic [Tanacetum cinerariifolium]
MVQKSGIQCYNCKEYGHVAIECQKPKRAKDAAYYREKMLLCKREEAGIQLNAEQAYWKDDTDDESDDQELEAHYMYMAKIQEVSPDAVDTGPIFDKEPEQKLKAELKRRDSIEYATDMELECAKVKAEFYTYKKESQMSCVKNTQTINDLNQTISEMKNKLSAHQDTISILKQQKDAQIKLYKSREDKEIEKVIDLENKVKVLDNIVYKTGQTVQMMNMLNNKYRTSFVKPEYLKKAKQANPRLYDIGCYNDNLALMLSPESDEEEMVADLRYFNSFEFEVDSLRSQLETQKTEFPNEIDRLSREYYYANHMNAILGVYTELNEVTNLQCDYLELLQKCECLETELSKSKMMLKSFESVQKHAINLELELQQCKEKKIVASESNKKPRKNVRKLHERFGKTYRWTYIKFTPSRYIWKPKSKQENVNPNVSFSLDKLIEIVLFIINFGCSKHMTGNLKLLINFVEKFLGTLVEIVLFIVDSRCSKHMTGNLKLLINFVENFLGTVKFRKDQIAPILGYGDLVQGSIMIKWVYYVEGLNHNLFSIGQFCDADLEVAFRKSTRYIHDLKGNDLLTGACGELDGFVLVSDEGDMAFLRKKVKSEVTVGIRVLLQVLLWIRGDEVVGYVTIGRILKNLLDRVSQLHYSFLLSERLKADNMGKYVTHAKNNMNMSTVMYVEIFTHLRTYEEHALKSLKKKEQSSAIVDPLAYLAKTTPTHSTTSPVIVPTPQSSGDSYNDAMLATMNQIANLLSGLQKQRASGNTGNKGIHTTGLDAKAEVFLADVECTALYDQPLALTTTNLFKANHEDAYDSDVDEGPHASVAFMANLSSTGGTNDSRSSHINEVQISDDSFFSDVSYLLAHEMQQEEHLNFKVDSVLDDNMITYDEYQNDSEVEAVSTVVSADEVDKQSRIAVLQRMHTKIIGYVRVNDEYKLVNATLTTELERCKIEMQALERNKVKHDLDMAIVKRNKQNAELEEENVMLKSTLKSKVVSIENLQQESKHVLSEKKTLKDKYLEEIVVLTNANKVATNVLKGFQMPTHTIPMLSKRPNFASHDLHKTGLEYERILLEKKNMQIEKKNLLITNECLIANSIANDICSIALAYDLVVPPSSDSSHCMLKELRTTCNTEHSRVLELDAEILKKQQVINDAEKRCDFIQNEHVKLQLKFQKYKECDTSNFTASNAILEINKLKEQFQVRDDSIRNLHAQNDIMSMLNVRSTDDSCNKQALETELTQLKDTVTSLKIQKDGYKVTNTNLNMCYEELSKANTHLRTTSLEKIAAQKAKIATLNAKTVGNKTSGTTKPANPKKQVTFQETLKPSPRFTKKPVAPLLKKPNVNVPLSTGIKSATGASKPASKSNAWIYRKLPAKSTKGEKVENTLGI